MSVITTEKDFTRNNSSDAGYFRIGFVTLRIPPEDIDTSRTVNNESIQTIRGTNEMFRKTGQSRWDVSVSWNALLNDKSPTVRYEQWEDLINILAMFKAAPFVEVESLHLRQLLAAKDPTFSSKTSLLSMGLRQLRIESHPDIIDGLKVTLTMTYFNCAPYSQDFKYLDDAGSPVAAYQSNKFRSYISEWRRNNIDRPFRHYGDPMCEPWKTQKPGAFSFKWREYLPVMTGQVPEWANRIDAPATVGGVVVPSNITPRKPRGRVALPPEVEQIIQTTAPQYGLDPAIMKALCFTESSGNPNAHTGLSSAKGLFQLIDGTARTLGVTDSFDPQQNTNGACKYIAQLKQQFGSYETALAAYLTGPACVQCYLKGTSKVISGQMVNPNGDVTGGIPPAGVPAAWADAPAYVSKVLGIAETVYGYNGASSYVPQTMPPAVTTHASTTSASPASGTNPVTVTTASAEGQFEQFLSDLQAQGKIQNADGWQIDHRADPGGVGVLFLYKEKELNLAPFDAAGDTIQPGLWPLQFSVLFVNNLAQVPLAAYQYPTYQHVGPCCSVVKVSFMSKGDTIAGTDEPIHEGLIGLTSMAHSIEQQYHRLKTQFRSVQSVHRMQAIYLENQVLNMLGLSGLMLHDITTQTLPESADMVMAQLSGSQYENRFENLSAYRVNAIGDQYTQALEDTVLNSDKLLQASKNAAPEERPMIAAALDYRGQMGAADEEELATRLLTAAKQTPDTPLFPLMQGADVFFVSETDADGLTNQFKDKAAAYPVAVERLRQLRQSGQYTYWTMADYLMFKEVAFEVAGASGVMQVTTSIDMGITDTRNITRQSMVRDAYKRLFPYFAVNDVPLRNALNVVMDSPILGKDITEAVSAQDPALGNGDHGAYRDMGLTSMVVDGEDYNPGVYFTNSKKQYAESAKAAMVDLMKQTVTAATMLGTSTSNQQKAAAGQPLQGPNTQQGSLTLPVVGSSIPFGQIPLTATTSIPGNENSIMKMINIPGYSMAEAFPTYKLFFMEDSSSGIYYAFDNFYSYASVTDIEIQRPYNRPATMRLKLMNLTHLLNHKLFDRSLAGKWEASLTPYANSSGGALSTDVQQQQFVGKSGIGGASFQLGMDNTEGYEGGDMANRRIPLQYFPLQTGTKIQVRMGFTNNPDKLTPVFQGQVTEIEGNEVLTITAQSYLLELAALPADQMQKNSWFQLGAILESPLKLIPSMSTGPGPAYGGVTIFGDSGDAGSVLSGMLKSSNASHFGRWQINRPSNPLLKGFGWKELTTKFGSEVSPLANELGGGLGLRVDKSGADNISRVLQNTYDRSDENIMVDVAVSYDGTSTPVDPSSNGRSWMDQRKFPWTPAKYFIDAKTEMTVWELMQDVARRYPEYVLLEKWYGFPYSCDSTLVFGHPLDWYRARPTMFGDAEQLRSKAQNPSSYRDWWLAAGAREFRDLMDQKTFVGTLRNDDKVKLMGMAYESYEGLRAASQALLDIYANGYHDTANPWVNTTLRAWTDVTATFFKLDANRIKYVQSKLAAVEDMYTKYLTAGNQQAADMLKPVRRYHFIDHQSIVHNGIKLNDKVYNAVRICDPDKNGKGYPINANANIPSNHLRMLDVTDQINDPKRNVIDQSVTGTTGLIMAYAQSFLREELGKMYRGELVLRGIPEIEPLDILLITDPSTGMQGPIEVDTVTHVLNAEEGYITIVKPRALVCVNEAASANLLRMLTMAMGTVLPEILHIKDAAGYTIAGIAGAGAAVGTGVAGGVVSTFGSGVATVGQVGIHTAGQLLGSASVLTDETATAIITSDIAAASTGSALGELAAGGVALMSGPVGWAVLGLCVVGAAAGVWWFTDATAKANPLVICPCTKFGRPWVGGIEGWAMNDLVGVARNKAMQFMADEVFPLLDSWRGLHGYQLPMPQTSAAQFNQANPPVAP